MYAIEAAPGPGRASMAGDPPQTMQRQINYRAAGYEYDTEVSVDPAELAKALDTFAKGARRLVAPAEDQEDATQALRTKLADWADGKKDIAGKLQDLRTEKGVELLGQVRQESNAHAQPASADLIETLQVALDDLRRPAKTAPIPQQLDTAIESELPVFIYFENYGILDYSGLKVDLITFDVRIKNAEKRLLKIYPIMPRGFIGSKSRWGVEHQA